MSVVDPIYYGLMRDMENSRVMESGLHNDPPGLPVKLRAWTDATF